MITIQGSYAGINTIRNISLIHRSISRTMRRLDHVKSPETTGENISQAVDDMALARRMRVQIGSVTDQIKELEGNLKRNQAADAGIDRLTEIAGNLKEEIEKAVANPDATADERDQFQARSDELASLFNKSLNEAEYAGEKLFSAEQSRGKKITELPELKVDTPEAAVDSLAEVEILVRELNDYKSRLAVQSRAEYEAAIKEFQVASQNLAAADVGVRDSGSAIESADEANRMIQRNVGLAAVAQGHLTSESVFQLLHA